MESKLYRVTCKCGHVGLDRFIRIDFPIMAENAHEATLAARWLPRVKHHKKDAVLECREIDFEEYQILQKINNEDPYLKCSSRQEQDLSPEIMERTEKEDAISDQHIKHSKRDILAYRLKKAKEKIDSILEYAKEDASYWDLSLESEAGLV